MTNEEPPRIDIQLITALEVAQQEEEAMINAFFGPPSLGPPESPATRGRGRGHGRGRGRGGSGGRGRRRGTLTGPYTTYARGHEGQFGVIQF